MTRLGWLFPLTRTRVMIGFSPVRSVSQRRCRDCFEAAERVGIIEPETARERLGLIVRSDMKPA